MDTSRPRLAQSCFALPHHLAQGFEAFDLIKCNQSLLGVIAQMQLLEGIARAYLFELDTPKDPSEDVSQLEQTLTG